MDDNIMPGMVTVAEAARRLHRSTEQVRRYLREGKLAGRRIGGQWFIQEDALPITYEPREPEAHRIGEAAAMTYEAKTDDRAAYRARIEKLIADVEADREAIRKRRGGNITVSVVDLLREDREEH